MILKELGGLEKEEHKKGWNLVFTLYFSIRGQGARGVALEPKIPTENAKRLPEKVRGGANGKVKNRTLLKPKRVRHPIRLSALSLRHPPILVRRRSAGVLFELLETVF